MTDLGLVLVDAAETDRSRSMSVVATPTSISTAWVACQSGWPMKVAALKYEARSFAGFDIIQCLPF